MPTKYLILDRPLVGAAGFEPTTCSTQNCRATRLRYTPIFRKDLVDTRLKTHQQDGMHEAGPPEHRSKMLSDNKTITRCLSAQQDGSARPVAPLFPAEQRVTHAIAGSDAVFLRRAGDHLQHPLRQSPRRDDLG
jgi:hypothetical protein